MVPRNRQLLTCAEQQQAIPARSRNIRTAVLILIFPDTIAANALIGNFSVQGALIAAPVSDTVIGVMQTEGLEQIVLHGNRRWFVSTKITKNYYLQLLNVNTLII